MQQQFFLLHPLGACGGVNRSNINKFQLQSQFQRLFIPNFVCVLTNERYTTYQTRFSFKHLGHVSGVGLGGAVGAQGVNIFFSRNNRVAYQIEGDDKQNRMQLNFSP